MAISIVSLELRQLADLSRVEVSAEIEMDMTSPVIGKARLSARMTVWTGDNPTLPVLRQRVIDALGKAFGAGGTV